MVGNSSTAATSGAVAGKNAVENNFLGATSSEKLDKAVEKIKAGDKSLATAKDLINLENADKRSDALMDKFRHDPTSLSGSERIELNSYIRVYGTEMQSVYSSKKGQEMVASLFANPGYERNPDADALKQAQSTINTWGYHESNASIGNAALATLGSGVLGNMIKESMITNAAIGTAVNSAVQLNSPDPFSYLDAIMAGVTSAATTGQSWKSSMAINMGGAAIGSAVKGEDPTNASLAAGAASVIGGVGGTIVKGATSLVAKDGTSEITGAVAGSYIGEKAGKIAENYLDKKDEKNDKK